MRVFNRLRQAWRGIFEGVQPVTSIAINLPIDPSRDDLRRAREIIAFIGSLSSAGAIAPTESIDEDEPAPVGSVVPGEKDSTGLIWDVRIHAGNHAKNVDGSWRRKRGITESIVAQVEAELRAAPAAPALVPPPVPTVTAPAVPTAPVVAPPPAPAVPTAPVVAPPPAPAVPVATPPIAPTVVPPVTVNPYVEMMRGIAGLTTSGRIKNTDVTAACALFSVANAIALNDAANHAYIPGVMAYLENVAGGIDAATAAAVAKATVGVA